MRIIRQTVAMLMLVAFAAGVSGCNTVKGAGKDLQRGGEAIENAAERVGN